MWPMQVSLLSTIQKSELSPSTIQKCKLCLSTIQKSAVEKSNANNSQSLSSSAVPRDGRDLRVTARLLTYFQIQYCNSLPGIYLILIQADESNCMDPVSGLLCAGHGECVCGVGYFKILYWITYVHDFKYIVVLILDQI